MQGLDAILGSSGTDLGSLGARFGLSPEQTRSAMGALLPAVAGGFQKRADANDLGSVTDVGSAIDQPDTQNGNAVLGQIFGGKDVSRQVAAHAAGQSGVPHAVMKALLPVVAAMAAKHFASNAGGGGLGGLLGSVLGGAAPQGGGRGGMLGSSAGGNPLDTILAGLR